MPTARMCKATIMTTLDMLQEVVETLHGMGAVEITNAIKSVEERTQCANDIHPVRPQAEEIRQTRLELAKTEFIIDLLKEHGEEKTGFLGSFIRERAHATYDEFVTVKKRLDLEKLYRELEKQDVELRKLDARSDELREKLIDLMPWEGLELALPSLMKMKSVAFRAYALDVQRFPEWAMDVEKNCAFSFWELVSKGDGKARIAALIHQEELEKFSDIAELHGAEPYFFDIEGDTVAQSIELIKRELEYAEVRRQRIIETIRLHRHLMHELFILHDYLKGELEKKEAAAFFARTERVVIIEGWIEEDRTAELSQKLGWMEEAAHIEFSPPLEGEQPPTILKNRKRIRPAENLIELFGLPNSAESDPTPFVAPFFILFFGMCIGDVGYGLILALIFVLAQKKLDVTDKTKSFLRLFMYCGLAAMLVGMFTRGYFGIESAKLPGFLRFKGSMDVLMDPIPIMIICVALGLLHISIGVGIEMCDNIRSGSILAGLCEQGTTLLLWLGLAVTAVGAGISIATIRTAGIYLMLAGAGGVVFLSNIKSKTLAGKLFGGLYNMYGLFSSTIGDVASYLRLYALGLATVAIGSINLMAGMVFKVPVAGVVLMVLVLIFGHIFNVAINFLGAFVHPLRLQYVEFFSKFYENGGRPFRPFGLSTEMTVLERTE